MNRVVTIALSTALLFLGTMTIARAENMSSSSYQLFFGNFNVTSGNKTGASYNLSDTVGQIAPGQYGLENNVVKAGFQYIFPIDSFTFKISPISIDFGSLTIGSPATAQQFIEVTAVGAGGYTVKVSEDTPLQLITNSSVTIPDTSCDSSCSETTAGVWSSSSAYGFGYNMSGHDVPGAFVDSSYFKQFADISAAETPQTIMSSVSVGTKRHATLTYKVNISSLQEAGTYNTTITYTAIPGY